jgi:16S RNA G1207 methylase RsmC
MFEVAKNYEQRMDSWSKLLAPVFIEFVGVRGEVLDVGCGTGSLTFTAAANKDVSRIVGIDHREDFVMSNDMANAEWVAFIAQLETAEEEFVQGRPAAFQALWSVADDVTLCGGFGGVERGWQNVTARLSWVSKKYSDGTRNREEISRMVGPDFAYLVQTEVIRSRVASQAEPSTQELRATMVFRREADGWRIVHRHADSQIATRPPQ